MTVEICLSIIIILLSTLVLQKVYDTNSLFIAVIGIIISLSGMAFGIALLYNLVYVN